MRSSLPGLLAQYASGGVASVHALEDAASMPLWIPGDQVAGPAPRLTVRLRFEHTADGSTLQLPLYRHLDDSRVDGCFAASLRMAIRFADTQRFDAVLRDGDAGALFTHDRLLALRDILAAGRAPAPLSQADVLLQRETMMSFVTRACTYCAAQPDVQMLHLATFTPQGAREMLVGLLTARNYLAHATALTCLSRQMFLPAWRFMLIDEANDPLSLMDALSARSPCYRKLAPSWWRRVACRVRPAAMPAAAEVPPAHWPPSPP